MTITLGMAWFENSIAGNELWRFLAWLCVVLLAYLAGRVSRHFLNRAAGVMSRRDKHVVSILLRAAGRSVVFVLVAVALKSGLHFLVMDEAVAAITLSASSVLMVVAVTYVLYCGIDGLCHVWAAAAARTPSKMDDMLVPLVRRTAKVTVVVLGLIQIATLLSEKPLTSILAGLGVGGLAVALAAQDTIKNFFGSVTVLTDKPFELGDFISIDKYSGAVEEVGVRSTRLRTLDGNLVTIPNSELASKVIENMGNKKFFRRSMVCHLPCDTPPEVVERALAIIRESLANHPGSRPDLPPRVYLAELGLNALVIQVLFWFHGPDYWEFVAFSESVNLAIIRRFQTEGIALAVSVPGILNRTVS